MIDNPQFKLVARVLQLIAVDFQSQPSLDQIAQAVGVSKFHLQRTFTQWAGVSPKRFLQFLTLEHAKGLLAESEPILRTAFASGLSGPGRLHDLFVTVESVTPGEYKAGGSSVTIRHGIQPTPFGPALMGSTSRGLCHLSFLQGPETEDLEAGVKILRGEWPGATLVRDDELTARMAGAVFPPQEMPSQERPLSLFLKGTNFQIKVWSALLRIPPGAITSYGGLARLMGNPGSARAVGGAVARNPIAYLIPCHRVIRDIGHLGGYRWGAPRKEAILGWEAARFWKERKQGALDTGVPET
jgi:AraC family transcriptional regulator of adaptative response/methylated-DNA-[protein]-cysteine methyltransferase